MRRQRCEGHIACPSAGPDWRASWPRSSCSACRAPASRVARPTRPEPRRPGRACSSTEPATAGRRGTGRARGAARRCGGSAGSRARWTGCTDRGPTAAVTRFQSAARSRPTESSVRPTRRALTRAQDQPLRRGAGFAQPDGIAAGAFAPGRSCGARASARPGGRPVRAADPGRGERAPAVRWGARQRRGHRPGRGRLLAGDGGQPEQRASTSPTEERAGAAAAAASRRQRPDRQRPARGPTTPRRRPTSR